MKVETFQYTKKYGWNETLERASNLDSENTVVFIFGSPEMKAKQTLFSELERNFPRSVKIGCSDSGEIFGRHLFDNSLSVAAVQFNRSLVRLVSSPIKDMSNSYFVGYQLAEQLKDKDLVGVFVVSDGLLTNGSELVRGMNSVLPGVIITGGLAGAGEGFKETWVVSGGKPEAGVVTALGFYGDGLHIEHGSKGGWDPFGPERIVTRAHQNILYELDGQPALKLYKEYLGEQAVNLPASALLFPLQIRSNEKDSKRVVRSVIGVDEDKNAMIFAGNIPEGALAQLMMANFDRLIEGASSAASQTHHESAVKEPSLTIAISCVGRRLVLGERTDEEIDAIFEQLPKQGQQIGFYSNGEISPLVRGQSCELHNQTMTLTSIYEESEV